MPHYKIVTTLTRRTTLFQEEAPDLETARSRWEHNVAVHNALSAKDTRLTNSSLDLIQEEHMDLLEVVESNETVQQSDLRKSLGLRGQE